MPIKLELRQFDEPLLEFGGPGEFTDPRVGLREGGPFDLRFGAARSDRINIGLIGPKDMVEKTAGWLLRCQGEFPEDSGRMKYPAFPGFEAVFHSRLTLDARWTIGFEGSPSELEEALSITNPKERFEKVLEVYSAGVRRLASLEMLKPDLVICCLPVDLLAKCWTLNQVPTKEEKVAAAAIRKRQAKRQLDLFDPQAFDPQSVEEQPEDLLSRDFRRALKARAMRERMPVQIATENLITDHDRNQGPATRAWNSSVALYYKSGGIPWRLKLDGPETCFVGISFHHLRTTERQIVQSSIAQAFSSQGEGFALRGGNIEWSESQGRNVHLTEDQARQLASDILSEYHDRTGGIPVRVVLHKTSAFSAGESKGFRSALASVPVVELINIMPTQFRLIRFGAYPPNRGTLCTVNGSTAFLFTTGFMQELSTYPGPHIPAPAEIRSDGPIDIERAARDILGLTRMNWNTASITGGHPVTLSFARRVGGIMAEYGLNSDEKPLSSFRYYM